MSIGAIFYIFNSYPNPNYIFGASTGGSDFLLKTYKYRISKIPTVLTTSKTINQTLLSCLAAFQSAIPFQINDHMTTIANTNPAVPAKPGGADVAKKLCKFIILKLIINNHRTSQLFYNKNKFKTIRFLLSTKKT
jgi:hypothetical protein